MKVPKKLFERSIESVEIGISDIYLYQEDEIEKGQLGYRVKSDGELIEDWIGDNYIIIGKDSCCGDPIIADITDKNLPIYYMFHDDWDSLQHIAYSFEQFLELLEMIDETDISNEVEKDELIEKILDNCPEDGSDFWESIIQCAYEFYNGMD